MPNIFFTSDTHFGHEKLVTVFKRKDGSPARNFSCVEEMDEYMISQWNSVVRPSDTIYHLGDVVINRKHLHKLSRLNGKKRLVRGNHDIFNDAEYHQYFKRLLGVKVFPKHGVICSHIPVHPNQLEHRWKYCFHGHLHANLVLDADGNPDKRYINLCGEHWDYVPQSLDSLVSLRKQNARY